MGDIISCGNEENQDDAVRHTLVVKSDDKINDVRFTIKNDP